MGAERSCGLLGLVPRRAHSQPMHYNTHLLYTPPLEPHEFNDRALILDTETIGSGPLTEVIEVALG